MLTDTHCHLDFSDFNPDREAVIQRARDQGVTRFVSIGTTLESSRAALALSEKHAGVYATVGIHPNEAMEAPGQVYDLLRELAAHPKVVALGECGLDYHYLPSKLQKSAFASADAALLSTSSGSLESQMADDEVKNCQNSIFRQQLDLAVELGLNVVVHQRDSWTDTVSILEEYQGKLRAVFHCFGGSLEEAEDLIAQNHLVSFTGLITFKNAQMVQETAAKISEGNFMVETDCPYLAPVPHRGKRCEPAFTRLVAERLAHLRGCSLEKIAQATEATANSFFRFPA
jgi:TatD DNase family protein